MAYPSVTGAVSLPASRGGRPIDQKGSDHGGPLAAPHPEIQEQLGRIGRTKVYESIVAGDIEVVKIGSRTLATHESLERYVRSLSENRPRGGA